MISVSHEGFGFPVKYFCELETFLMGLPYHFGSLISRTGHCFQGYLEGCYDKGSFQDSGFDEGFTFPV